LRTTKQGVFHELLANFAIGQRPFGIAPIALANEIRYQVDSSELIMSDAEMTKRLGGAIGQRWLHVQGF
jgi:hypothetical protein